jgi:hypothetical protein
MARARIVVGTTAVGGAADGPVRHHEARSYSRNADAVKAACFDPHRAKPEYAINLAPILH